MASPANGSEQLGGLVVKLKDEVSAPVPRHCPTPCFHQSGKPALPSTRTSPLKPRNSSTNGGGTNEPIKENVDPVFVLHAKLLMLGFKEMQHSVFYLSL